MSVLNKTGKKSILRIWKFGAEFQIRRMFQKNKKNLGTWIKQEITSLGPAFIKIGQFMSTRIDIFGKDVTDELSKLQDNIDPIPFNFIDDIIREELQEKYNEILYIDEKAIATASIGQVHKGKLKNNKDIVLKVQKPNITEEIKEDLKILSDFNSIFLKFDNMQAKEMDMLLKQYEKFLTNELNYIQEMNQMITFRKFMNELPLYIPEPYKELSTNRVLTMEYVDSIKITEIKNYKNINTIEVAQQLIDIFLNQIIVYGIIHCDPHPGNIGVREDGTIILYDFGNVVTLSPTFRKNINNLIFAIYQKDTDEFVDILLKMNIIELENNLDLLELKSFFEYFFNYLETLDFNKLKQSIVNPDVKLTIKVRINQDFLSLFRVFSLIDGTCSYLNPKFNYITALSPYSQDLFTDMSFINTRITKDIQKISSYPAMLKNTDQNIIRLNKKISKITANTKYLLLSFLVLDNITDPAKLVIFLPIIIYILLKN
jgi:ubiquinone biosynthesis protein